jgi:hypothetical protein
MTEISETCERRFFSRDMEENRRSVSIFRYFRIWEKSLVEFLTVIDNVKIF